MFKKLFGKIKNISCAKLTRNQEPKFVRHDVRQDGRVYEVFQGYDSESAKAFLATRKVTKKKYYVVVETPDGNWGADIEGLYLERLRDWQTNIDLAEYEAIAQTHNMFSAQMAARGVNDNFIAKVNCGNCGSDWLDGIRYKSITVVKCPYCESFNKLEFCEIAVQSSEKFTVL